MSDLTKELETSVQTRQHDGLAKLSSLKMQSTS